MEFETDDLKSVLEGISIGTGLLVPPAGYVRLWAIEREESGTFKTGTTAERFEAPIGGHVWINSIRAEQEGSDGAIASLMLYPFSVDGISPPLTHYGAKVDLAADGAPTPTLNSWYFLGPIYWGQDASSLTNNVDLEGLLGWTLNTGITFSARPFKGHVFAKKGSIVQRRQTIEFRTTDVGGLREQLADLFLYTVDTPTDVGDKPLRLHLRQAVDCGTRYANNTANHIRLTCDAACASMNDLSFSENDDGIGSVTLHLNAPPTIAVDQKIEFAMPYA